MKIISSFLLLFFIQFSFGQTTNMPYVGSASIIGCSGTIRDHGAGGNYSNNANGTLTICSTNPAQFISISFSQLNLEAGYDYLKIYSGNGVSGAAIATFTGSNIPTSPYLISNSCVTLAFTSDGSVVGTGFQLTYSCVSGASCSDGIQNGTETGVDCGGCSSCPPCASSTSTSSITASASSYNLPCGGGTVNLNSVGVSNTPVLNSNFNLGFVGPGWSFTGSGVFNNPCGPNPNGTIYLWFGNTSPHPRILTTKAMNLLCGGQVCFNLRFSIQGGAGACEGPDLPNEGVTLEYSTNCGNSFTNLAYFHTNGTIIGANPGTTSPGINGPTAFTTWGNYCFTLPPAAQTSNTILRWRQLATSGAAYDTWGIDEVMINANSCNSYYYDWTHVPGSNNSSSTTVNVTTTSTYNVIFTNGIDDSSTASVTINVAGPAQSTISTTPVNHCISANSGSATFTGSGSTSTPYIFTLNGPNGFTTTVTNNSSATVNNLYPRQYTLTTSDGTGCFKVDTFSIGQGPLCCDIVLTPTNLTCNALNEPCDGTISANAINGLAPYTYQWYQGAGTTTPIGGQTSQNIDSLCVGTYTLQISDQTGCVTTETTTLTQPTLLTLNAVPTNINCYGANNGSVVLTSSGGTTNYSFTLGSTTNSTGIFNNLTPGSYPYEVIDANGCTIANSTTITEPTELNIAIDLFQPSKCDLNNGSIHVSASGGTTAYSFSNGATTNSTGIFSNLAPGTYTITVTDANGCTKSTYPIVIEDLASPVISLDNSTDEPCFGSNSGSILVSATGNSNSFLYSMNGGAYSTNNSYPNLAAGNYTITVQDTNLCTSSILVTISSPGLLTLNSVPTNVSCHGACNGSVINNVSGGTGPYEFSSDGGLTFSTTPINNLCPGSYFMVVKDALGCLANHNITITEPTLITFTSTTTAATCGNNNGSFEFNTFSGGSGAPYTVSYGGSSFSSTLTYSSLPPGFDTVFVKDNSGCQIQSLALISNIEAPYIVNVTVTNNLCFGGAAGSIQAVTTPSIGGLLPPYFFSINGGPSTAGNLNSGADNLFSGLLNGQYVTQVTDNNGCVSLDTLTIISPTEIQIASIKENVLCNGSSTGYIQLFASGGNSSGYFFSLNNGATINSTGEFLNLPAGSYTPWVQDGSGCIKTGSPIVITQPTPIVVNPSTTDPNCHNVCDGQITLSASGGVPGYLYSINNGTNYYASNTFNTVCSGTTFYSVKDNNGCTMGLSVVLNNPSPVTLSLAEVDASCGAANGSITATGAGGTLAAGGGYTYSFNGGAFGVLNTFSSLNAGTYSVSVHDSHGCSFTATPTLTQSGAVSIPNLNITNAPCNGDFGAIDVVINGGTAPINFSLNGGISQLSPIFTGIPVGPNSITVTDALNCIALSNFTITEPAILTIPTPTIDDVLCNGGSSGSIAVNPAGGTAPFTYSFDGGTNYSSLNTISSVSAGTYPIEVTDNNGCVAVYNATIAEPSAITTALVVTDATCFEYCDGQIELNPTGGVPPYQYNWAFNIGSPNSNTATNVCAGEYYVTVTDAHNCLLMTNNLIVNDQPLVEIVSATSDSVSCNGLSDGVITVIANNVVSYTVVGPSGTFTNNTGIFNGLAAGFYEVTVQNNLMCEATTDLFVYEPEVLVLTTSGDVDVCFNNPTTHSGFATGGTQPYTFSWNTGFVGQEYVVSSTLPNTLSLTVTDVNNCSAGPESINITVIPQLEIDLIPDQYVCAGDSVFIAATAQFGVIDYIFNWTHLDETSDTNATWLTGSSNPSSYWVQVKDLCQHEDSVEVLVYEYQPATFDLTGPSDGCNPQLESFEIINSSTPLSNCSWDFGNSLTATGCGVQTSNYDSVGVYSVQFTYEAYTGCPFDTTFTNVLEIFENPTIDSVVITDPLCFGSSDGTALVYASGGTPNYSYQLDAGALQLTNDFSTLSSGNYSITLSDIYNCVTSETITLTDPTQLAFTAITITDALCFGSSDGVIQISVLGGTPGYQFSFDGGLTYQNESYDSTLLAGAYHIFVQDSHLCQIDSAHVVVGEPILLEISTVDITDASCFGFSDGEIEITPSGGTTPYSYSWSANAATGNSNVATNLAAGIYSITVTDDHLCVVDSMNITVGSPPQILLTSIITDSVNCFGVSDGEVTLAGTNVDQFEIINSTAISVGPQASGTFTSLAADAYDVVLYDVNGCQVDSNFSIFEPLLLEITNVVVDSVICHGDSTGSISITAIGGTGSYLYSFYGGTQVSASTNNQLPASIYNLFVEDANGCLADTIGVELFEPTILAIDSLQITNATCFGDDDGSIFIFVSGGTGAYQYAWQNVTPNPGNTDNVVNINADIYGVTITDANGCSTDSLTIAVTQPPEIVLVDLLVDSVKCFGGADGILNISTLNGTNFILTGPVNATQAIGTFVGLPAGNYNIEIEDVNECSITIDTAIYAPNLFTISTGNDTIVCANTNAQLSAFGAGGTTPYSFTWNGFPTGANQNANTAVTTTYYVSAQDANGCSTGPDSTIVTIFNGLTTNSLNDVSVCPGSRYAASITVNTGVPGYNYVWAPAPFTGQGTANASLSAGNYTVTVTDQCGDQVVESILISNFVKPLLNFTGLNSGCAPLSIIANSNNLTISNCSWNFGDGATANTCGATPHVFENSGVYSVAFDFTSADGCAFDTTIVNAITVSASPVASFTYSPNNPDLTFNKVEFTNTSSGGSQFFWDFDGVSSSGQENPTFSFPSEEAADYSVCLTVTEIYSTYSCASSICETISLNEAYSLYVPTAFTPNGNEFNELFKASILGEKEGSFVMQIFDRWGELVFESHDPEIGWDGTYKNKICPDGNYIWKIELKAINNDDAFKEVGNFILFR